MQGFVVGREKRGIFRESFPAARLQALYRAGKVSDLVSYVVDKEFPVRFAE
jgi:hypothetical protein